MEREKLGSLVLSRECEQAVQIGEGADQVWVQVVRYERGRVRLRLVAPKSVRIHRRSAAELREWEGGSDG